MYHNFLSFFGLNGSPVLLPVANSQINYTQEMMPTKALPEFKVMKDDKG